jgi:hypothetical protein
MHALTSAVEAVVWIERGRPPSSTVFGAGPADGLLKRGFTPAWTIKVLGPFGTNAIPAVIPADRAKRNSFSSYNKRF